MLKIVLFSFFANKALVATRRTGGHEGVAALRQDLHQVVGEVTSGQVETHDGVGQSVALIDGHVVGHTVTRVQHNTWSPPGNKKHKTVLLNCIRRVTLCTGLHKSVLYAV